jgi:calcineurin-like phosphoesterase family protein
MLDIITNPAKNIWFISDTHFGHANFLNFKHTDGEYIRKFDNVKAMDECMTTHWNENIKPGDKVYHLGDVAMGGPAVVNSIGRLNGHKRLIVGNHDVIKGELMNQFHKISMWRVFREYDFICTHVPLREDSMMTTFNLHGHIHKHPSPSDRHMNICVEHHDYKPVHLDTILAELARRKATIGEIPRAY